MSFAICTLFEGHYHFGVAALTNSLYKRGFRGSVYAGYRGDLPGWAKNLKDTTSFEWKGSKTMDVADGLQIHFLPLETEYLFANYKPHFMLSLAEGPAKQSKGLVYFDPDIVVKCDWSFLEYWMSCGIAVVHEIINNDMPPTHPIRKGWEKVIANSNRQVTATLHSYLNSGFCGLAMEHVEFLKVWCEFMEVAINEYGFDSKSFHPLPRSHIFFSGDQDAFNIAAMSSGCPLSEMGPEGMDFISGGWIMSHGTWRPKPWNKNYFKLALKGYPPTRADREYWKNVLSPIPSYGKRSKVISNIRRVKFAALIGRFYRRH